MYKFDDIKQQFVKYVLDKANLYSDVFLLHIMKIAEYPQEDKVDELSNEIADVLTGKLQKE